MIKPASFEKEFFVVLTLKGKVLRLAERIQSLIAEHYGIYDKNYYPKLHLTLDRIDKTKLDKTVEILEDLFFSPRPILISISELNCMKISKKENLLVINVKNTASLISMTTTVHNILSENKISTIDNYKEWNFHITVINNNFSVNPMSKDDISDLCYLARDFKVPFSSYADKLEIWRPTLDPEKKVVYSYNLPDGEEINCQKK